jgi:hypothetical protein
MVWHKVWFGTLVKLIDSATPRGGETALLGTAAGIAGVYRRPLARFRPR